MSGEKDGHAVNHSIKDIPDGKPQVPKWQSNHIEGLCNVPLNSVRVFRQSCRVRRCHIGCKIGIAILMAV